MRHAFFAMTALLAAASASFGAAWTTPAGSNSSFSYTNGHDGNGLFGDGSANTGGFNFSPTTYVATSSNGVFAIVNDEVSVEVFAAPGKTITGVSAHLLGDFTIFGTGGANKLNAPLTIINYSDSNAVAATPIVYTGLPVTTTTSANGILRRQWVDRSFARHDAHQDQPSGLSECILGRRQFIAQPAEGCQHHGDHRRARADGVAGEPRGRWRVHPTQEVNPLRVGQVSTLTCGERRDGSQM